MDRFEKEQEEKKYEEKYSKMERDSEEFITSVMEDYETRLRENPEKNKPLRKGAGNHVSALCQACQDGVCKFYSK